MRQSSVKYHPELSIAENAKRNSCSVANIRYYIKTHGIDRQYEVKASIVLKLRKYYIDGMSKRRLAKQSGHSINTICKYWNNVVGEEDLYVSHEKKVRKLTVKHRKEYYATHPQVTQDLLDVEKFSSPILEPCCGGGFMAKVIQENGYDVEASDIVDRGYGKAGIDFLSETFLAGKYDIVTNPPYSLFVQMLRKAIEICNHKVAMLLPLNFLSALERLELYKQYPPKKVWVFSHRICIAKGGNFDNYQAGANMTIYAWYIWEKGYSGETTIGWL